MMNMRDFSERICLYMIPSSSTLLETIKRMDEVRVKSLLVMEGESFVGMVTIGDLQRAIIAKQPFNIPVANIVNNPPA